MIAQPGPCIGQNPTCPCQDGDACHYEDTPTTKGWPVPDDQTGALRQQPEAVDHGSLLERDRRVRAAFETFMTMASEFGFAEGAHTLRFQDDAAHFSVSFWKKPGEST